MNTETNATNESAFSSPAFRLGGYLFCFAVYFAVSFDVINLPVDDVYISLRYVWNFINGNGLTFNPGEHVEGYSNPTWVLVISLIAKILNINDRFELIIVNRLVSFVVCFVSYVYLYRTIRIYNKNYQVTIFFLLVLCSLYPLNIYAFMGMETSLLLLLLSVFFFHFNRYLVYGSALSLKISSVFLGLLSISRPEGIIYIVAFVVSYLIHKMYYRKQSIIQSVKQTLGASYISLLIFAFFLLFRIAYYGELLPNTAASKNYFDVDSAVRGAQYVMAGTFEFLGGFLCMFGFVIGKNSFKRNNHLFMLLATIMVLQFAFIIYTGWDWMPGFRFVLPIAPLLYFAIFFELKLIGRWLMPFLVLILVIFVYYQRNDLRESYPHISGFNQIRLVSTEYKDVSEYLNTIKSPDDLLLIQEAGYVPYATDIKTVDLGGLTDKHIASLYGPHFLVVDLNYCLLIRKPTLILTFETDYDKKTNRYYSEDYFQSDAVLQSDYFIQNYEVIYYKYNIALFCLKGRNVRQKVFEPE